MQYQGEGKYTVTIKDKIITDVTIADIRNFYDNLDKNLSQELYYRFKKKYRAGEFSFEDIDDLLNGKIKYDGNLTTDFVQDVYKQINKTTPISKKKVAKMIAEKLNKSVKTIEKHLYKKF